MFLYRRKTLEVRTDEAQQKAEIKVKQDEIKLLLPLAGIIAMTLHYLGLTAW